MNIKEFIVSRFQMFFFLVTMILFAQMVLGNAIEPQRVFHYKDFVGTFFMAFLCVLPTIAVYSKKEPDLKGTIIREAIQFVLIEAIMMILAITKIESSPHKPVSIAAIAVAVAVIFVIALLIEWYKQRSESKKMTELLKEIQNNQ